MKVRARNPLYHRKGTRRIQKLNSALREYFALCASILQPDWSRKRKGFFCTNNGINVLIRIYEACLSHYGRRPSKAELRKVLRAVRRWLRETYASTDRLEELRKAGFVSERTDLARSGIGVAVKSGARKPDIRSGEAVKQAVLAARGIAYSTGPSGIYLMELFRRMGIAESIQPKVKQVQGEPAGGVVARGEAEIAFQQVSELLPVPGTDFVGPLPADIQQITVFSAGLHVKAAQPDAARALVKFLTAPAAAPVIRKKGMEPA
jgi:hypothetical protein